MKHAVVGTGYWGENHLRVASELRENGLIDDVVICDSDKDRASDLATTYGVEYETDHKRVHADTATVATPSPTHKDVAVSLLERGIDLLVEKPLALTAEDAWEIVRRAEQYGRTLGVGHIFRYHPALCELKRRIDRGEFGRIKYLHTSRFSFRVPRETTGVLYSLAVHDVDIYRFLLGRHPDRVYCTRDSFVRDGIDETATLVLDYGEATGVIDASWQVPVFGKSRHLAVVGTERAAYLDYLKNTELEVYDAQIFEDGDRLRARNEAGITHHAPEAEPLKTEVKDFIESSKQSDPPLANGRIGADAIDLLDRAADADAADTTLQYDPRWDPGGPDDSSG